MFSWLLVLLCKTGELLFAKIKLTFEFMMLPQVKWYSQQSKSPAPSALEIQKKEKLQNSGQPGVKSGPKLGSWS